MVMRILGIFASLLLLGSCTKPVAPEYRRIENFSIQSVGLDTSVLGMNLVYFNPNNFGVSLRKIDCEIYMNKVYVGKFLLDTFIGIDKRAEFVIPSKVKVGMKTLYRNGLAMLINPEVLIEARGNTRVGKGGIFFNVPVNYSGKHKLLF